MARISTSSSQQSPKPPLLIQLWLLRILVPLGAWRSFIGVLGFENQLLAESFGLDGLDLPENTDQARKLVRYELTKRHREVERKRRYAYSHPGLAKNILKLAEILGLNKAESRILEFAVMVQVDRVLSDVADWLGPITNIRLYYVLSILLDLPEAEIQAALSGQGKLARSGLVSVDNSTNLHLGTKLDLLSATMANRLLDPTNDPVSILRDVVVPSAEPTLEPAHFEHVSESVEMLRLYLSQAKQTQRTGVNVYIHGAPGTGKTQLARLLAKQIGCELFEVASADEDGDPIGGFKRLRVYRAAQCFFERRPAIILFDEVEDVFNDGNDLFGEKSTARRHKAWLNRMLELNTVPTIWLSNTVDGVDPAFVRRFDLVVDLPVPPKSVRQKVITESLGDLIPLENIERIASSDSLVPAVISRSADVVRLILEARPEMSAGQTMERIVSNTLVAQGHDPLPKAHASQSVVGYAIDCVNTNVGLQSVADGIAQTREGRICLYGPPGTGKSAYGRWMADRLGLPLHVKRVSDLASKWVGSTERNIARAFTVAQEEGALLLIDEVDSFLQDRGHARQTWEITAVNEMLAQMEQYSGVLIATTNLMEDMDPAAMRRFDVKVRFDYLNATQAWTLLGRYCMALGIEDVADGLKQRLERLDCLTPGDFAATYRHSRLCATRSAEGYVAALEDECSLKRGHRLTAMGFV